MQEQIFFFSSDSSLKIEYPDKETLGNKGGNLVEMCRVGIPVPPGLILGTEICKKFDADGCLSDDIISKIKGVLCEVERVSGKQFGSFSNPLLLSVRSGAIISMPGMMDTVLNIGLNDQIVSSASAEQQLFIYDSYRRLIQMYGGIVMGVDEEILKSISFSYETSTEKSLDEVKSLIEALKEAILYHSGIAFPQCVHTQLIEAIKAVFNSWHSERAIIYRQRNGIDNNLATAATVQAMVFGNRDDNSYTGVLFTRNPITGEKGIFGEFLTNAQGEDVVSGAFNANPLTISDAERSNIATDSSLEIKDPKVFSELKDIALSLEQHFKDMQDIEFTVESGELWILQTRTGKRSAAAAAKIAVDLVSEGLLSEEQALKKLDADMIEKSIHKQLVVTDKDSVIARGLAASPGAASGVIALTAERAEKLSKNNPVILIRNETSPEDILGMYASEGIVTARGGVTSHAAVVARGIGKPCICCCENLIIVDDENVIINGIAFKEGDCVTINGSTGEVFSGRLEMKPAEISDDFMKIISWMSKHQKIDVLANAETPADLKAAIRFGAKGIGLCRTEHMFFDINRINDVRLMILADSVEGRKKFLEKISEYQKSDFTELLDILDGKPICIRLLDPPLHEFLPQNEEDIIAFCKIAGYDICAVKKRIKSLHEHNPMLGHRGCRLGITFPEIYEAQVRSIFESIAEYESSSGKKAKVEIMVPLPFSVKELLFIKNIIKGVELEVFTSSEAKRYCFGAMIELPRMALLADTIAEHVDFVSFGTNDLTQSTLGISRDDSSKFLNDYMDNKIITTDPFASIDIEGVGQLVSIAIEKIRSKSPSVKVGVCGEHGGDPESIKFFYSIGVDYVSCSPYRLPVAALTASVLHNN